jgi:hypothetical protein
MAATTIAFYGIRLEVTEDEIESLEDRTHPAIANARKAGVQFYWDNFGVPGEAYFLFVGTLLGKLGIEDGHEIRITADQLSKLATDVSRKLFDAGFTENPALLIQFQPDE